MTLIVVAFIKRFVGRWFVHFSEGEVVEDTSYGQEAVENGQTEEKLGFVGHECPS